MKRRATLPKTSWSDPETSHALVAPFPQFLMLGFAGKRRLLETPSLQAAAEASLAAALATEFVNLQARYTKFPVNLVGISALALGADAVFAETLFRNGGLLRAFLPERPDLFFNAEDFDNDPRLLARSRRLLEHPGVIERHIPGGELSRDARFAQCATDIVDACDVFLVSVTATEWSEFLRWKDGIAEARARLRTLLKQRSSGRRAAEEAEIEQARRTLAAEEAFPPVFSPGGSGQTLCYAFLIGRECRVFIAGADGCACHALDRDMAGSLVPAAEPEDGKGRQSVPVGELGEAMADVFNARIRPAELKDFDYPAAVDTSCELADQLAMKGKNRFMRQTMLIVAIHIAATAVATFGLVWHCGHAFAAGFKVLLLAWGLGLAVHVARDRRNVQDAWVNQRMIAEILRSVRAICGLGGVPPIPCNMKHLRDFFLPEFRQLIRSLNILQLREVSRSLAGIHDPSVLVNAWADHYCGSRIDDQLRYYRKMARLGHKQQHHFEWAFFAFSSIALICALCAFFSCFGTGPAEASGWFLHSALLVVTRFIPIVFPVLAAAMMVLGSIYDLGRRCGSYTDMIAVLTQAREPMRSSVSVNSLVHRIHLLEHQLLQENVEAYSSMRNLRAG